VISIHRDDHENLQKTLQSMSTQQALDVEFIVVDGSKDPNRTTVICEEFFGASVKVVLANPQGIYSAMNTGLEYAKGQYVSFLNAGDTLHSGQVLNRLKVFASGKNQDWIYGNVQLIDSHGRKRLAPKFNYDREREHNFRSGRFPMQPGSLVKTELIRSLGGFDSSLKVAADYKVILGLSKVVSPSYFDDVVVDFTLGGTSSKRWISAYIEAHRARSEVFSFSRLDRIRDLLLSIPLYIKAFGSRILGRV